MFEAIYNTAASIMFLTIFLMMTTFPGWLTGKIVARRNRVLPVPFFFQPKLLRWILWYIAGIVMGLSIVLATRPIGTFAPSTRLAMALIAVLAFAASLSTAFYIGWTATAKRLARIDHHMSSPANMAQGVFTEAYPADIEKRLPEPSADDYAPAKPNEQ